GSRLAIALAPDHLAAQDLREKPLLLLLGPVDDERGAGEAHGDAERPRRASFSELAVEDELLHDGHAGTAVLLWPGGGNPLPLRELLHELAAAFLGEGVGRTALTFRRRLGDKAAHLLAECGLF